MPLSLQGLIGVSVIAVLFVAWFLIIVIADDFIDRFKKHHKTQKNALAAATTNTQRK